MAKARRLATEFGATALPRKQLRKVECDIIVNATSVGMTPATGAIPVPASLLRGKVVFDAVYNPPVTRMLREARARGAKIVSGVEMYLNQAARQSALFTGVRPNVRRMRQILMKHL